MVPSVFEATPQRQRPLGQLGDLLAVVVACVRQLGEGRRRLEGAALVVRRRYPVALGAGMLSPEVPVREELAAKARTEQIGVSTGSIKTLSQRRDSAGNQLYLHAFQPLSV
jgi:hypothetical protein